MFIAWLVYFSPYHITHISLTSSRYTWAIFTYTGTDEIIKKNAHYLIKWPDNRALDAGLKPGDIIIKKTMCMPGELFAVHNTQIQCEGVYIGTFSAGEGENGQQQYKNWPFPALSRLSQDQYYVEGDTAHSYDSRQFGPLPRSAFWGTILIGI